MFGEIALGLLRAFHGARAFVLVNEDWRLADPALCAGAATNFECAFLPLSSCRPRREGPGPVAGAALGAIQGAGRSPATMSALSVAVVLLCFCLMKSRNDAMLLGAGFRDRWPSRPETS